MASPEAQGVAGSAIDALILILRFHELAVDPAQIRHQFAGASFGIAEILRCAKEFKLKARAITTDWGRLAKTPLPARWRNAATGASSCWPGLSTTKR